LALTTGCGDTTAPAPAARGFVAVSAGAGHVCALTSAGVVFCRGGNGQGELGIGSSSPYVSALTPILGPYRFKKVDAGDAYTCGITTADQLACWGTAGLGQLGFPVASRDCNFTACVPRPTLTRLGATYLDVSAGTGITCGLRTGGALDCFGSYPPSVTYDGVIDAGPYARSSVGDWRCALTADGTAYCWGQNDWGQVGDSTRTLRPLPTPVVGGLRFVQITTSPNQTCGRTAGGAVYCWGWDDAGVFGNGTPSGLPQPFPVLAADGATFDAVTIQAYLGCALDDGLAYCWGGLFAGAGSPTVPTLVDSSAWLALDVSGVRCGIKTDSLVYCWEQYDDRVPVLIPGQTP
jgi:hypothetical protein